jgi:hypothetical protein
MMTAMRMAQSNDVDHPVPSKSYQNPTNSYQTATPQQLQAAGIAPVVLNNRVNPPSRYPASHHQQPSSQADSINRAPSHDNITQLSPYHRQLLQTRRGPSTVSFSLFPSLFSLTLPFLLSGWFFLQWQ